MKKTILLPILSFLSVIVAAQVRLPQLISDGMVLQRDQPIEIRGWASPGENVRITFAGRSKNAVTSSSGSWSAQFPARPAGGPFTMEIDGASHLTIKDILIGDVFFCSGQSNMVIPMERVKEKYPEEITGADFPQIRNFFIPTVSDVQQPHNDLPASKWMAATPENVLKFGAASWFFAKELHQRYHIPIGIINSSVGGMPIQAWISAEGLKDIPNYRDRVAQIRDSAWHPSDTVTVLPPTTDEGLTSSVKWYDPSYTPEGWRPFWLPGYWADQGVHGLNGIVWFRKVIDVPASMAGKPAKLFVGRIVDADETYVNGTKVGNITYQYPPRRYEVPAGLLKAGKNVLVVRVTNYTGKGGFVPDKRYELTDGTTHVDIRGDWQYKVGAAFPVMPPAKPTFSAESEPTGLYNTMVAPVTHTAIKAFLWYQGEANAWNPGEYKALLPALISDWRNKWGRQDLPFLYVQLPNFMDMQYTPSESSWAVIREAQLQALSIPHTGMAVTIDAGEWNDIHPLNKKDVGQRLALAARVVVYGEKGLEYAGPLFRSMERKGDSVYLHFTHTGSGLVAKGSRLKGFSVAGADNHFVWADAVIAGDAVIVHSSQVANPAAVRYAWADNPGDANLYNREGLPASPFRTDIPHMTAAEDHHRMMQLLHIDSLRPGPSGNPKAPNAANTDESKATPYTRLPDPLTLNNGKKVTTAALWWKQRRPEIVEDFDREIYGRTPEHTPAVHWELVSRANDTVGGIPVITKKLIGHVDNSSYPAISVNIDLTLTTPAAAKTPVPVILELGFKWPAGVRLPDPPPGPKMPTGQELVIAKGWGFAVIYPTSIQADNGAGLTDGIIGLVNKGQQRKPDDWGALKAWAWGASRALDYFGTDPAVDARQVGIEGLSRYGKATAVAMAYEPRFAVGFIGSSGEGGVKIHRRYFGEQVENVASSFEYHWMAGNFIKYAGPLTPNDLPVDAHELVALCAPRPVFISSGSPQVEGTWVDAKGMFLGGVGAGPVYRLLGKKDLGTTEFPPIETALVDGDIAWRQHSGGHTTGPNWPAFLQWASRYIRTK